MKWNLVIILGTKLLIDTITWSFLDIFFINNWPDIEILSQLSNKTRSKWNKTLIKIRTNAKTVWMYIIISILIDILNYRLSTFHKIIYFSIHIWSIKPQKRANFRILTFSLESYLLSKTILMYFVFLIFIGLYLFSKSII